MIWQKPSLHPVLSKNQVHLWRANLDLLTAEVDSLATILSSDELERASKFCFAEHRRRFVVTRAILRQLLGNYLDISPEDLKFDYGNLGKPQLVKSDLVSPLQFNISHSQEYALFGFTNHHLIGVDIEYLKEMPDAVKIAQRFFSPREFSLISNSAIDEQPKLFFKLWTAKEAYLKAIGVGLTGSLASVDISIHQDGQTSLLSIQGDLIAANRWSIYSCVPAADYIATVAIKSNITEQQIVFWSWN